jgi:hypothetical protein
VKIDAVLGEIERSLLFIPREHSGSVATLCRYVKVGPTERVRCNDGLGVTFRKRTVVLSLDVAVG